MLLPDWVRHPRHLVVKDFTDLSFHLVCNDQSHQQLLLQFENEIFSSIVVKNPVVAAFNNFLLLDDSGIVLI